MARPKRNDLATKGLTKALAKLARKHPASPDDIEYFARSSYNLRVSDETIRKALRGEIDPTACSLELLLTLRAFYKVDIDGLGPHAAERMKAAVASMPAPPPSGGGSVTGESESACTRWAQVIAFPSRLVDAEVNTERKVVGVGG